MIMTEIFYLGGAGDTTFIPNMLKSAEIYGNDQYDIVRIRYPGSIGPINRTPNPLDWKEGLKESRDVGKARLAAAIRETKSIPIVIGYSLGAYVISDFLEEKCSGKHQDLEIAQTITIGNPRHFTGGIAGSHRLFPKNHSHFEIAAIDDVMCRCDKNSALKKIPYFVEAVTGLGYSDTTSFMSMILTGLSTSYWRLSSRDIELCWKYLNRTGHERDYFKTQYLKQLKDAIDFRG